MCFLGNDHLVNCLNMRKYLKMLFAPTEALPTRSNSSTSDEGTLRTCSDSSIIHELETGDWGDGDRLKQKTDVTLEKVNLTFLATFYSVGFLLSG